MSDVYEGDWRLFSYDPVTGRRVWHLDMGDHIIQRTETPVDEIISQNAEDYSNSLSRSWGDGQRVASIPLDVFYSELAEAVKQDDQRYLRRWLNDADHSKFRTFKGRV